MTNQLIIQDILEVDHKIAGTNDIHKMRSRSSNIRPIRKIKGAKTIEKFRQLRILI